MARGLLKEWTGRSIELNNMALIPPFFMDAVVAVGFPGPNGEPIYQATGFLYGQFMEKVNEETKRYRIYLVTNRHVFEDKEQAWVRFNPEGDEAAREYRLDLESPEGRLWYTHSDPEIDIAVIGINARILEEEGIEFSYFQSDAHVMTRSEAASDDVAEGDGVFVLGFPMGLVGEGRNFVIVRNGIFARIRDCLERKQKDFLIDCLIFPGNSGGPVVTKPQASAITGTKATKSSNLLGVVAAYVPYKDFAISQQTGRPRIIFEENSGLAKVFPTDYIEDVIAEVNRTAVPPSEEAESGRGEEV